MSSLKNLSTLVLSSILFSSCATSPVPQGRIKINYSSPEPLKEYPAYIQKQQTLNNYSQKEKEVDFHAQGEIMKKKFEELNQYLLNITR